MLKNLLSITTYHFPKNPSMDFAKVVTLNARPWFSVCGDLSYEDGENKLNAMAETFKVSIETREYDETIIHEITVPLN